MTHFHRSRLAAIYSYLSTFGRALGRIYEWPQAWMSRCNRHLHVLSVFRQLLAMSDHTLADIGLSREQLVYDRLRYRLTGEAPDYIR